MEILMLVGAIIVLIGSLFLLLAALGLIRMPDIYSRMQAGTKASTLGILMVVIGLVFLVPEVWSRLILLGVFVLLTNPVSAHALIRSAHYQGADPLDVHLPGRSVKSVDELKIWKQEQGIEQLGGDIDSGSNEKGARA